MRTGEPDALDAAHLVHGFEQSREVAVGFVWRLVVVHYLTEQLDFLQALLRRRTHLRQDVRLRPHPLVAPRVRDHAEAAVLVAALDDRHPRADRICAPREAER